MADAPKELWVRFARGEAAGFGRLDGDAIVVHAGDMFDRPQPTGETLPLAGTELLAPTAPSKIIALWKNLKGLAAKLNQDPPEEPLYLLKAPSSVVGPGAVVRRPKSYAGRVAFEGELGIVIGKRLKDASVEEAEAGIFGYTCVNDITAGELIDKDPSFAQWARSKSFDGFGAFGPAVATGLDPATLAIRTVLNGSERQNYPVNDMFFLPADLVSRLSHDMTLEPGDLIACGTSTGVGAMKDPENVVEVIIDGVGVLKNTFLA
ncbi:2-hydroxyhepta-2,4-diene-1,7-dioate isomerase [Methylopila jiangsuensis]|uniref:2-hydroxyhepta-2,4-diene-1,7-dioate isomerase n=1 Tax=Methylopila jiangsuensis TaxID=586230 RepID=A0A9W6JHX4_9HYPH|nr:fumarylacetoacetate hydrolase family protein [Methylopila jiangsuensis]MDR6285091.1 2-keto-4-pentenoate hydratase/2-oxohepta-3-ene-1,7-dioic acid hydratase in catechol pathway [Methylopila jiangsuensis]GLK77522.1 2-hydroxyhepta-2,4-diene-1,7-dioate isomerase [Methylopila jiangsuensis]